MESGEDWLLRPVLAGMCQYESLVNGVLNLEDIACMNDALAVQQENKARVERALAATRR